MKKIFFVFLFILILLAGFSSAYQKKVAIKECLVSFNEVPDSNGNVAFAPWNDATNSGVFMKIENKNLVLGESQTSNYIYTFYQNNGQPRQYFNNTAVSGSSFIPILNVKEGGNNKVFINCTFLVGSYNVVLQDFNLMYNGDDWGLHLTEDFNLTQNIFSERNKLNRGVFTTKISDNNILNNYFYEYLPPSFSLSPVYSFFDNKINPVLYNYDPLYSASHYNTRVFFPNTYPVAIQNIPISNFPTGIFRSYSLIRENGNQALLDFPRIIFYINNSRPSVKISDFFVAEIIGYHSDVLKKDGSVHNFPEYVYTSSCSLNDDSCYVVEEGDVFRYNLTIKNNFNLATSGSVRVFLASDLYWTGGVGSGTSVPYLSMAKDFSFSIDPFEEKSFFSEFVIPKEGKYAYPVLGVVSYIYPKAVSPGRGASSYMWIGGDKIDYLGIMRFDPRISIKFNPDGSYNPVIDMSAELFSYKNRIPTSVYVPSIEPYEYSLYVRLINQTGAIKDNIDYLLDESAFESMGLCSSGVCSLPTDQKKEFNFSIPIKREYFQDALNGEVYKIRFYTNKTTNPFGGLFASNKVDSYFKPGDIVYPLDTNLYFYNNSRIATGRVLLFNPSFYESDFNLTIKSISSNKFNISYQKSVHLYPLQSLEMDVSFNTTFSPWVSSLENHAMVLEVSSSINSGDSVSKVTSEVPFKMVLSPLNSGSWCNFYPTGISPLEINFDYDGSEKKEEITASWTILSSSVNPNLFKNYTVNVSVIDNSLNSVLYSFLRNFTMDSSQTKNLTFNYTFSSNVSYSVSIHIDYFNVLTKSDASGIKSISQLREDNLRKYAIYMRVDGCYHNLTTNRIYTKDILGNSVYSDCSKCSSVCEKKGLSCQRGMCFDPFSFNCANYKTISSCNDLTKVSGDWCAWNSNSNTKCSACGSIMNSCSAYDNQETCNLDPCNKSSRDSINFKSDFTKGYKCSWVNNKCTFSYDSCSYEISVISSCDAGNGLQSILYKNINPDISGCEEKRIDIPCAGQIQLPFFGTFGVLTVLGIIFGFYCLLIAKRKLQALN